MYSSAGAIEASDNTWCPIIDSLLYMVYSQNLFLRKHNFTDPRPVCVAPFILHVLVILYRYCKGVDHSSGGCALSPLNPSDQFGEV